MGAPFRDFKETQPAKAITTAGTHFAQYSAADITAKVSYDHSNQWAFAEVTTFTQNTDYSHELKVLGGSSFDEEVASVAINSTGSYRVPVRGNQGGSQWHGENVKVAFVVTAAVASPSGAIALTGEIGFAAGEQI